MSLTKALLYFTPEPTSPDNGMTFGDTAKLIQRILTNCFRWRASIRMDHTGSARLSLCLAWAMKCKGGHRQKFSLRKFIGWQTMKQQRYYCYKNEVSFPATLTRHDKHCSQYLRQGLLSVGQCVMALICACGLKRPESFMSEV